MTDKEEKNLIEQIKSGEIKMHSRSYFLARTALQVLGLVLALLLAVFLASYVFFHLKVSGAFGLTGFGLIGVRDLLLSLPWLILILVIFFTGLLLWFAEHYAIAYRNPLLYSAFGILLIVFVGGFFVAKTPLHRYFFKTFGREGMRAPMHRFYSRPRGMMLHNGLIGKIEAVPPPYFLVRDFAGKPYRVMVTETTNFLPARGDLLINNVVLIHGRIQGETMEAWDIKKIDRDEINCGPFCNTK